MALLPEIETLRMMGPTESIEDARAVVITVAKAVGGQITPQDLKAAVSEWLNKSTMLTEQDHKDLLERLEQEVLKKKLDSSQRRCQALSGPAPIGWSTGFSYSTGETCQLRHTPDLAECDKQLVKDSMDIGIQLKKVQEEDKERV